MLSSYQVELDRRTRWLSTQAIQPWVESVRHDLARYFDVWLSASSSAEHAAGGGNFKDFPQHTLVGSLLSQEQRQAWPAGLIEAVEQALLQPDHSNLDLANWLIGLSLVDALVRRARIAKDILLIAPLLATHNMRHLAFRHTITALPTPALPSIIEGISALVEHTNQTAAHYLPGRRHEDLAAALRHWQANARLGDVWTRQQWRHLELLFSSKLSLLGILCTQAPEYFLPLCDQLQALPLLENMLRYPFIAQDMNCLLQLLAKAPIALEPSTGTWNRSMVAPLLLEIAFDHVMALGSPPSRDEEPLAQDTELVKLAQAIVQTALSRADGAFLMSGWVRHLIELADRKVNLNVFRVTFNAIIDCLARADFTAVGEHPLQTEESEPSASMSACTPQWSRNAGRLALEQFLLEAMLEQERAEIGMCQAPSNLRPRLLYLLKHSRDAFFEYKPSSITWRHTVVGMLYLNEPSIADAWRQDFASFSPERRASLHWSYENDSTLIYPSFFLSRVGLALMELCCASDEVSPLRPQAIQIWNALFESVWTYLTHPVLNDRDWHSIAWAVFAWYPSCVRAAGITVDQTHAIACLDRLGGDDALFAAALTALEQNGMQIRDIAPDEATAERWLSRIQRYIGWASSTGKRTLPTGIINHWKNPRRSTGLSAG
ncbi:hypothetical protein [Pseudomonas aeruginosa]|uniref:hypothetical protein n=1 Tax=Pseudomonas aeruginosa TaxID=287 RepID=UPI000F7D64FB|nr:hypothetical protein [Pseudomonas aeruginosa]RTB44115.1 hypothetical protein EJ655_08230 [Pseudomonas aeruginosa]